MRYHISKMKKIIFLFLLLTVHYSVVIAQQKTGDVGDEQVTVVKAYQPALSEAIKINDVPQKDTALFSTPDLNYTVESKKLETKYNITPIKPVKIKDESIKKLYRGFIKGGYGNYNTPYFEVFYNALRSKEFDAGVHLRHLSSSGDIKGYGFPGFSENNIDFFGNKYLTDAVVSGKIGYDRDVVHYYGYSDPPHIYSKKETLHRMGTVHGDFGVASSHNSKDRLDYKAGIGFYGYSDNIEQSETYFNIRGFVGKHLNKGHYISGDVDVDISKAEFPGDACPPGVECIQNGSPNTENRTLFSINPRYEFTKEGIIISAGANVTVESAYDESKWHFYPVVEAKYPLIKEELTVFGQIGGKLKKNSIRSMNAENPFLTPSPVEELNILVNTDNKFDVRGGLTVKPDRELQVSAWAAFSKLSDDVFYINSLNTTGITYYSPAYYDNKQFNLHVEAEYKNTDKFGIDLKTDYFSYNVPDSVQPWFRPEFLFTLGGNYNIANKIFTKVELFYTGSRTAVSIDGKGTTLKSYVDVNLGVDYRYSKNLSIFVRLNNLTATRYYIWYNYPSYKLNAMVGASYSF